MAHLRKLVLLLSAALLIGCGETASNEYRLAGYESASWQWRVNDTESPEITQNTVSETTADVSSIEAAEPSNADRSRITAGAVIAVVALIALVVLADDTKACSGSGCASTSQ